MPQTGVEVPTYFFESLGYMVPDRHMDPYFAEFLPLTKEMEPKGHMHPGLSFFTCWMASCRYTMATRNACWRAAMRFILTRALPTPTSAREGSLRGRLL